MSELTERQIEYLLAFATLEGKSSCISEVAERFGIAKSTVSVASDTLVQLNLIKKSSGGVIKLTAKAKKIIKPKLDLAEKIASLLPSRTGLEPEVAEAEGRKVVSYLRQEVIDVFIDSFDYPINDGFGADELLPDLAEGAYSLDLILCKKGSSDLSMGHGGLMSPARLIKQDNSSMVEVGFRKIDCQGNAADNSRSGFVERLWYQFVNCWHEAKGVVTGEDIVLFRLPGAAVQPKEGNCFIRLRLRISVGMHSMPESEADLLLNLGNLKVVSE